MFLKFRIHGISFEEERVTKMKLLVYTPHRDTLKILLGLMNPNASVRYTTISTTMA